jgi:hypothetical protein
MAWDTMDEFKANWHLLSDDVELYGEEGTWSVYTHECDSKMHLCIANDQYGSIKLLNLKVDVDDISHAVATQVRTYRGVKASDKITNFDLFMMTTSDKNFVTGVNAFLIG